MDSRKQWDQFFYHIVPPSFPTVRHLSLWVILKQHDPSKLKSKSELTLVKNINSIWITFLTSLVFKLEQAAKNTRRDGEMCSMWTV